MPEQILILIDGDPHLDPRVRRQIEALSGAYDIAVASSSLHAGGGYRSLELWRPAPLPLHRKPQRLAHLVRRRFDRFYWHPIREEAALRLQDVARRSAVILANELPTLLLGLKLSEQGPKLMFDAHEFYPGEWTSLRWRSIWGPYVDWLCAYGLPRAHCVTTVSRGVADAYEQRYGIKCELVRNIPPYQSLHPGEGDGSKIRLVHHGAALPAREIERMITAMDFLDERYELELMLVADPANARYVEKLRRMADGRYRVRFRPPVAMNELCAALHGYDLGIYLLPPRGLNSRYALPNKLFEFIQARLGVVVSPNPDMVSLVSTYDVGQIARDFTAEGFAEAVAAIDRSDIQRYKDNAHRAARELCAEREAEILLHNVAKLVA